jgi:predicted SnoaL-like aldol condensation-catalyzing enzyme
MGVGTGGVVWHVERHGRGLRQHAARGALINTAFMVALSLLGFVRGFLLAHFLTRADYGVWGILVVSLGTIIWLKQVGIGDKYIQHNISIADGLSGLGAALAAMAEQGISMVYDKTHMVLADGDYALACSEGSFGGVPTTYYDLFRVENGFIAEHWDVMETLAAKETWANENGKF